MPSTDTDLMVGDIQGRSLPDQPPNSTALMDEPSAPEIAEEPSGHDEMWIYRTPLLMFMFMLSQMARIWFYLKTKVCPSVPCCVAYVLTCELGNCGKACGLEHASRRWCPVNY